MPRILLRTTEGTPHRFNPINMDVLAENEELIVDGNFDITTLPAIAAALGVHVPHLFTTDTRLVVSHGLDRFLMEYAAQEKVRTRIRAVAAWLQINQISAPKPGETRDITERATAGAKFLADVLRGDPAALAVGRTDSLPASRPGLGLI